jgi:hypothetical protein
MTARVRRACAALISIASLPALVLAAGLVVDSGRRWIV